MTKTKGNTISKTQRIREEAARIRANAAEEEDVMRWIAEYGVPIDSEERASSRK